MKTGSFLIIFLLLSLCTWSQHRHIQVDFISSKEGFKEQYVADILQDSIGFMWMATNHGLYKYDGVSTKNFNTQQACESCPSTEIGRVNSFVLDNRGLIWMSSTYGISVFDPVKETARLVVNILKDNILILGESDNNMIMDRLGNIWCTKDYGFKKITFKKHGNSEITRETIFNTPVDSLFIIEDFNLSVEIKSLSNIVSKLYEDSEGNVWIGCMNGLFVQKNGAKSFIKISDMNVTEIMRTDENTLLIVSNGELLQLTDLKKVLRNDPPVKYYSFSKIFQASGDRIISLATDRNHKIYLGTYNNIYQLRKGSGNTPYIESLLHSHMDVFNYNPAFRKLFVDKTGLLWVGMNYYGVAKLNINRFHFTSYQQIIEEHLSPADINPVLEDNEGNLWIGAYNNGLYKIENKTFEVKRYQNPDGNNGFVCLTETDPGIFLLGTNQGIIEFNSKNEKFRNPIVADNRVSENLRTSMVWDILKDKNLIYIAGCQLFVYDTELKSLKEFNILPFKDGAPFQNIGNTITSLIKLQSGEIWASSNSYEFLRIRIDTAVKGFVADPYIDKAIRNNLWVDNIYQDKNGLVWESTEMGLRSIDLNSKIVKNYPLIKDIKFPLVRSMLEDNHNNLWMGTQYGLCRFNKKTGVVKTFTRDDGLPILIHGHQSACKSKNGRMFFGGVGGFYSFHPDSISNNESVPAVVITDLWLFDKPVPVNTSGKSILKSNISYTRKINLNYDQNDLTFGFAALDYTQPGSNRYVYKLEGYQANWVEAGARNRVATYTNLSPGTYTFRVKGSNSDGVWNKQEAMLTVIIYPPWWGTMLARIMFAILVIIVVSGGIFWRLRILNKEKIALENLIKARTSELEEQKEEILVQKDEIRSQRDLLEQKNLQILELDQVKNHFFANISHEFRTPLSLIQSPVEELMNDPRRSEKERRKLSMIHRNTRRLLTLVNQLLDISKIDGAKMRLELMEGNVIKHVRAITGAFTSMAETKSIMYQCYFPGEDIVTWFDADKLEKILVNLLSNAFKFTPEGGEIEFRTRYIKRKDDENQYNLQFYVRDNGPGIPRNSLEKIFDRFYQLNDPVKTEGGGTGIGLSLTRDLIRLQHGEINVKSELSKGSIFTVVLPLGKEHLKESEYVIVKPGRDVVSEAGIEVYKKPENRNTMERIMEEENKKPFILIVEDNTDIRTQLYDELSMDYCIMEAIDGVAGLKKAIQFMPDLIISDLMMPRMDGIELCKQLKTDEHTSHIPVIMLTAKVTMDDIIIGLQTGADDYVSKPFHMAELKARIANLIESRQKLRERFSREVTLEPKDISVTSVDEKFLNRAIEIVESNMRQEDFDVTEFREKMNMSRSTLFRKLYALTNQSPTEFIRTIRLKRAASLLKQHYGNVTEVAMEVGFNNLSYFTKCFRKMYNVSPMDYMKEEEPA